MSLLCYRRHRFPPENFWLMYGRRPYAAFGNSSSDDQQMLEYVKAGSPGW
jgi:hypothetical protein